MVFDRDARPGQRIVWYLLFLSVVSAMVAYGATISAKDPTRAFPFKFNLPDFTDSDTPPPEKPTEQPTGTGQPREKPSNADRPDDSEYESAVPPK